MGSHRGEGGAGRDGQGHNLEDKSPSPEGRPKAGAINAQVRHYHGGNMNTTDTTVNGVTLEFDEVYCEIYGTQNGEEIVYQAFDLAMAGEVAQLLRNDGVKVEKIVLFD